MPAHRRLLVAALAVWLVAAVLALVWGPPFGHDESAFALIARGDGPPWLYRSRGVVALDELGLLLGSSDLAIRIPFVVVGLGLVLAVYAVGRAAFDARIGAWAAAVIAGAHPMVLRSAEAIGDLPATACLLAGIAVVVGELARPDGPRWWLVLAAPCFAGAFYCRYGSAPVIALAGVTAAILWWRAIARRPTPVLVTALALVALLVPHVLHSIEQTGSWSGVLEVSRAMPRRAYIGEGLVTYLTSNPFTFYGALVAPVMLAGLATAWRGGRAAWLLLVVALGQLVSLGLQSHGQSRYVFVATALLVVLGVKGLASLGRPRAALAAVVLAWVAALALVVPIQRGLTRSRALLVVAGDAVRADAAGRPCLVVAAMVPQMTWYAHCDGALASAAWPADRRAYVVSLPQLRVDAAAIAARERRGLLPLVTRDARAQVWAAR